MVSAPTSFPKKSPFPKSLAPDFPWLTAWFSASMPHTLNSDPCPLEAHCGRGVLGPPIPQVSNLLA